MGAVLLSPMVHVATPSAAAAAAADPVRAAVPSADAVPSSGAPPPAPAAAVAKPPSLLSPLPGDKPRGSDDPYELRRSNDGSGDLLYAAPGFDARIHRDGSVQFRDRHFSLTLFPWLPTRTAARGPTVESLLRGALTGKLLDTTNDRPTRPREALRPGDEPSLRMPTVSRYHADANEGCRYPNPCFFDAPVLLLSVAGSFDLTDELMRLGGKDPYRYEKARFMTGTRELRARLAARTHADDVRQATDHLRRRIEEIADDGALSVADRRAIIQALAAEMDAGTAEGQAARATIDEFLRTRFAPPDGGTRSSPSR